MKSRQIKTTIFILVCAWFINDLFVSGCATEKTSFIGSPEKKVCVIDLKSDIGKQVLLEGEPQTYGMRSGRVYLQPGASIGQHSTRGNEEVIVFLSGKGLALIGEKEDTFEVGQGKVCYIPPQTVHNIENTGPGPLIYIYCVAPVR
jgi:mannose-6-phosphate isomerase-like protein (cupin superfamily)